MAQKRLFGSFAVAITGLASALLAPRQAHAHYSCEPGTGSICYVADRGEKSCMADNEERYVAYGNGNTYDKCNPTSSPKPSPSPGPANTPKPTPKPSIPTGGSGRPPVPSPKPSPKPDMNIRKDGGDNLTEGGTVILHLGDSVGFYVTNNGQSGSALEVRSITASTGFSVSASSCSLSKGQFCEFSVSASGDVRTGAVRVTSNAPAHPSAVIHLKLVVDPSPSPQASPPASPPPSTPPPSPPATLNVTVNGQNVGDGGVIHLGGMVSKPTPQFTQVDRAWSMAITNTGRSTARIGYTLNSSDHSAFSLVTQQGTILPGQTSNDNQVKLAGQIRSDYPHYERVNFMIQYYSGNDGVQRTFRFSGEYEITKTPGASPPPSDDGSGSGPGSDSGGGSDDPPPPPSPAPRLEVRRGGNAVASGSEIDLGGFTAVPPGGNDTVRETMLRMHNVGTGALEISSVGPMNPPFAIVDSYTGPIQAGTSQRVLIRLTVAAGTAPGEYSDTIAIQSNGGSFSLRYKYQVSEPSSSPSPEPSPTPTPPPGTCTASFGELTYAMGTQSAKRHDPALPVTPWESIMLKAPVTFRDCTADQRNQKIQELKSASFELSLLDDADQDVSRDVDRSSKFEVLEESGNVFVTKSLQTSMEDENGWTRDHAARGSILMRGSVTAHIKAEGFGDSTATFDVGSCLHFLGEINATRRIILLVDGSSGITPSQVKKYGNGRLWADFQIKQPFAGILSTMSIYVDPTPGGSCPNDSNAFLKVTLSPTTSFGSCGSAPIDSSRTFTIMDTDKCLDEPNVAVHEAGHAIGGLGEEYYDPARQFPFTAANCQPASYYYQRPQYGQNMRTFKECGGGAAGKKWVRPSEESIMRNHYIKDNQFNWVDCAAILSGIAGETSANLQMNPDLILNYNYLAQCNQMSGIIHKKIGVGGQ